MLEGCQHAALRPHYVKGCSDLQVRVGALVQGVLDISAASPRRYFFEVLQYFSTSELEVDRLEYFATPAGRDDLYTYNQKEGLSQAPLFVAPSVVYHCDCLTGTKAASLLCLRPVMLAFVLLVLHEGQFVCLSLVTCGHEDAQNSMCMGCTRRHHSSSTGCILGCSGCRAHSAGSPARFQVSTAATGMVVADVTSPQASAVLHCLLPCQAPQLSAHPCCTCRLQHPLQAEEAGSVLIVACKLASKQGKPAREGNSPHQGISSVRICCC